jgi:large subunit ribosomal protein L10
MSKLIKQMEMDALKKTFGQVRDMVLLSPSGLNCQVDNQLRLALRKKNIRLQMVKNSLARRVFDELGFKLTSPWTNATVVAWGGSSIAELSRELEEVVKKNEKVLKIKGAVAEGVEITFEQAKKMPTRAEAVARVVTLALSPARRIAGQIRGPAARLAGQIKSLKDRAPAEGEKPAEAAAG